MASPYPARSGAAKVAVLFIVVGLLVGAGIMTPFLVKWRSSALEAQEETRATAKREDEAKQQAATLEKQKAEIKDNLTKAETQITTLKSDLTSAGASLEAAKQADAEKAKQLEQLKADLQKKDSAMTELDDKVKAAKQEAENTSKENTTLQGRVNAMRSELSRLAETIDVKTAEITKAVEAAKKEEDAKKAAMQDADQAHKAAEAAAAQAAAVEQELMSRAPARVEERRASKTGRQLGAKSGVPFAGALDPVGDIFTGIGEGLFGRKGPVIWVAVYKDKREEVIQREEAEKWGQRGVTVVRLNEKKK